MNVMAITTLNASFCGVPSSVFVQVWLPADNVCLFLRAQLVFILPPDPGGTTVSCHIMHLAVDNVTLMNNQPPNL